MDGEFLYPTKEVISAMHWLPMQGKPDWDKHGDLRFRISEAIGLLSDDSAICPEGFDIDEPVVMDPENPGPTKTIAASWLHADVHGIQTEETFFEAMQDRIVELADVIVKEQNPFQPVRIYKDANPTQHLGFHETHASVCFDWRGEPYPFDIRVVHRFDQWIFTSDKGEQVRSAGHLFQIATLVVPTAADRDVYVAQDLARIFD